MSTIREALEEEFRLGKLDYIKDDLKRFLDQHRETLQKLLSQELAGLQGGITRVVRRQNFDDDARFNLAVRLLVKQARTINPARDIKLQLADIAREVWLEGERQRRACTREDENRIAREWNERFGHRFRDWQLLRVLYVFDRYQEEFHQFFEELLAPMNNRGTSVTKKDPRKTG